MADSSLDRSLCLGVLWYASLSAVLSELLAWALLFRTPYYQRLTSSLDKANQRLDKMKDEPIAKGGKGKEKKGKEEGKPDKKLTMLEKEVQATNRDLTLIRVSLASVRTCSQGLDRVCEPASLPLL